MSKQREETQCIGFESRFFGEKSTNCFMACCTYEGKTAFVNLKKNVIDLLSRGDSVGKNH